MNNQDTSVLEELRNEVDKSFSGTDKLDNPFSKDVGFDSGKDTANFNEFQILDEVGPGEASENENENYDSDVPDEEIEQMLDGELPEELKAPRKEKERPFTTKSKIVLEEKGKNHFEVLPVDWIMVMHDSGIPVYLQRTTRIVTLSKPYFLGKTGSVRKHLIPVSSIPCLAYRRALDEEEKEIALNKRIAEEISKGTLVPNTIPACPYKDDRFSKLHSKIINNASKLDELKKNDGDTKKKLSKRTTEEKTDSNQERKKDRHEKNKDTIHKIVEGNNDISLEGSKIGSESTKDTKKRKSEDKSILNDEVKKVKKGDIKRIDSTDLGEEIEKVYNEITEETRTTSSVADKCEITNDEIKVVNDEMIGEKIEPIPSCSKDIDNKVFRSKINLTDNDNKYECNGNISDINSIISDTNNISNNINDTPENTQVQDNHINSCSDNLKETETAIDDIPKSKLPVVLPGGIVLPPVKIESIQENWKNQHLSHEEVTEYCKKVFKFKTINVVYFKHWYHRRRHSKATAAMQPPTMSRGTKLLTIPVPPGAQDDTANCGILGRPKRKQREWILNMNGQSYVSILTDFVRTALQKQPTYEFKQLENSATPYEATVLIDGMKYGVGLGSSKRQAKLAAAKETIQVLIPTIKDQIREDENKPPEPDLEFFDMMGIEDPRIIEFCNSTMEPPPHSILRVCLLRNFGVGERNITWEMNKLKNQHKHIQFTMSVGKHTTTVVCKNKKMGKQRASQAILQALHPHVKSWGSLLRLYGNHSIKSSRIRKMEEQEITLLQDKATANQPNHAVLEKLHTDLEKLNDQDESRKPIGMLIVKEGVPTLSSSRLNNNVEI